MLIPTSLVLSVTDTTTPQPLLNEYTLGLMTCEKITANMERMEEIDSFKYRRRQHFLTNSTWDHLRVIGKVQTQASEALAAQKKINGHPVALIVDESFPPQERESFGRLVPAVCGVRGQGRQLPGGRLCLPFAENWTEDARKCDRAGIPGDQREFRTKPRLTLEIIDECVESGVCFD